MKSFNYVVTDEVGIHARPASILAKEAKKYQSKVVIVNKDGKSAEAKKLMALMGLGIKCGDSIEVQVTGDDEDTASEELKVFFEKNL